MQSRAFSRFPLESRPRTHRTRSHSISVLFLLATRRHRPFSFEKDLEISLQFSGNLILQLSWAKTNRSSIENFATGYLEIDVTDAANTFPFVKTQLFLTSLKAVIVVIHWFNTANNRPLALRVHLSLVIVGNLGSIPNGLDRGYNARDGLNENEENKFLFTFIISDVFFFFSFLFSFAKCK